jgi:uncharacterized protein (TIGR04255 family)
MPFPPVERVKYNNTPLENVICQLRFPPILAIDSETPSEFQSLIRNEFPYYDEKIEFQQEISTALNINSPDQIVNPVTKVSSNKNHEFKSEESDWTINLTRTFISISTTNYSTWEEFLDKFKTPLLSIIKVYEPIHFTRIGLRYVDIFCRSKIGLEGHDWSDLIQPYFLGLLGSEVSSSVREYKSVSEIESEDKSSIIRITNSLIKRIDNNETCFLMDTDVFTNQKTKVEEAFPRLNYLHDRSSRLIRYSITDLLHKSLEPVKI